MAVAAITHFIEIGIQGSGRHLMEQWLPDVGSISLDKNDVVPPASIPVAQPRDQLQATGAAAYHDNLRLLQASTSILWPGHSDSCARQRYNAPTARIPLLALFDR